MKNHYQLLLSIALCLICISLNAQQLLEKQKEIDKEEAYYKAVFGESISSIPDGTIPEEWADEPVVILNKQFHINLLKGNKNGIDYKVILRQQIKIQEKVGIEGLAEFYFQESEIVVIRLIKSDGSVVDVDINEGLEVEGDVPSFYGDPYQNSAFFKLAIPNLEVGDIIDFVKIYYEDPLEPRMEIILPERESFPMINQDIILDMKDNTTIYYDSFNGAPVLKKKAKGGCDEKGKYKDDIRRFAANGKMAPEITGERWKYAYHVEPLIKAMLVPSGTPLSNKKKRVQKGLDVKEFFYKRLDKSGLIADQFVQYMKRNVDQHYRDGMPEKEAIEVIYAGLRYYALKMVSGFYDNDLASIYNLGYAYSLSRNYNTIMDDVFAIAFLELLDDADIKANLVMAVPRYYGGIENMVTSNEAEFAVYIPSTDKYYWAISNFSSCGENPSRFFGAEVLVAKNRKKLYEPSLIKKKIIPESKMNDHSTISKIKVVLNDDNTLSFDNTLKLKGQAKDWYERRFLYHTDFPIEDLRTANNEKQNKKLRKKEKKNKENRQKNKEKEAKEVFEDYNEQRQEILNGWLKNEYKGTEEGKFTLLSNGVNDGKELGIRFTFESEGYTSKAGKNRIFEIGSLIGDQVELGEEEINDRKNGVEFNNRKVIKNDISITLPAGLVASGLESLNMNVDNAIGGFVSTATQEGNVIKITTVKSYKENSIALSDWPSMVAFLEAAYEFTQKKVVLKKEG